MDTQLFLLTRVTRGCSGGRSRSLSSLGRLVEALPSPGWEGPARAGRSDRRDNGSPVWPGSGGSFARGDGGAGEGASSTRERGVSPRGAACTHSAPVRPVSASAGFPVGAPQAPRSGAPGLCSATAQAAVSGQRLCTRGSIPWPPAPPPRPLPEHLCWQGCPWLSPQTLTATLTSPGGHSGKRAPSNEALGCHPPGQVTSPQVGTTAWRPHSLLLLHLLAPSAPPIPFMGMSAQWGLLQQEP